jgi:hypothetical protein
MMCLVLGVACVSVEGTLFCVDAVDRMRPVDTRVRRAIRLETRVASSVRTACVDVGNGVGAFQALARDSD